jgi:hypothetical protein
MLFKLGDTEHARQCAETARTLVQRYERPWDIEVACREKEGDLESAVRLLDEKAKLFSRYPDIATQTREKQARMLRELGRDDEAARVLETQVRRVDDDRDDLASRLVLKQIDRYVSEGDAESARRELEDLLEDQIEEGQKLVGLIDKYLQITHKTGQTHEAARFLNRFIQRCVRRYGRERNNRQLFLKRLVRAYENDNDEKRAERTRKDMEH